MDSSLPFRVDLHVWEELHESFRENIKTGYVILQDDNPAMRMQLKKLNGYFPTPSKIQNWARFLKGGAIIRPSDNVLALFAMITNPMFAKMTQNQQQTITLEELRAGLLSKNDSSCFLE